MNVTDIDFALSQARGVALPEMPSIAGAAPTISKCDLATACQAFLSSLEPKAGFIGGIGVRMVHGMLTKWKRANSCP